MPKSPNFYWKKGAPLQSAWSYSATAEEHAFLIDLSGQEISAIDVQSDDFLSRAALSISAIIQGAQNRFSKIKELQNRLCDRLYNSELIGFGARAHWKNPSAFEKINPDFWYDTKIDWDKGSAVSGGLEIRKIRVVKLSEFPELENTQHIGRPTNRVPIYQVIEYLLENDKEFKNNPHKLRIEKIRVRISEIYPDIDPYGSGFGDDAIRKHTNHYFRTNKIK